MAAVQALRVPAPGQQIIRQVAVGDKVLFGFAPDEANMDFSQEGSDFQIAFDNGSSIVLRDFFAFIDSTLTLGGVDFLARDFLAAFAPDLVTAADEMVSGHLNEYKDGAGDLIGSVAPLPPPNLSPLLFTEFAAQESIPDAVVSGSGFGERNLPGEPGDLSVTMLAEIRDVLHSGIILGGSDVFAWHQNDQGGVDRIMDFDVLHDKLYFEEMFHGEDAADRIASLLDDGKLCLSLENADHLTVQYHEQRVEITLSGPIEQSLFALIHDDNDAAAKNLLLQQILQQTM